MIRIPVVTLNLPSTRVVNPDPIRFGIRIWAVPDPKRVRSKTTLKN